MSLSELVSALRLHLWAEIALVLFLALFLGVLLYTFGRRRAALFDRARRMPLDEA
ncbi:MAG TPA: CcoQ/FixQ family Cbb3-type cytochrome c oxidase assembly chaperone [Candidatus Polarisedimenticolaceae bacterium]|nr:CcoQ/FixQ family Cbb3-type cytochrome c oxidase assembly chaperone [Candidatus Polarisedimenticolaceae bacterium]